MCVAVAARLWPDDGSVQPGLSTSHSVCVCGGVWEAEIGKEREREREAISGVLDTPAIFRHNLGRCRIGQSGPESDKCSPAAHVALPRDEFTSQSHYNSDTRLLGQQSSIQNWMMPSKFNWSEHDGI